MNGGFNVRKIMSSDELMIMNDFQNNVNIVVNGDVLTQEQLVNNLYYNQDMMEKMRHNQFVPKSKPFKQLCDIPNEPKPLEPGQVDPTVFFRNSLKGLF
jgi:hypothetical protein